MSFKRYTPIWLILISMMIPLPIDAVDDGVKVLAKSSPNATWHSYSVLTLAQLSGYDSDASAVQLSRYGGWTAHRTEATGYFYPKKIANRWWLIDPEGYYFINIGVNSVSATGTPAAKRVFTQKFGTIDQWTDTTAQFLTENGFNGLGAWSDIAVFQKANHPMVYTRIWNFMSEFGYSKKVAYQVPGHTGYPNDCILIFDPDFAVFCNERAKALAAFKDDPYLLGHFSDNELPIAPDMLDRFLALNPNDPIQAWGYRAAWEWLRQRDGKTVTIEQIHPEDREAFIEFVYTRYFEITRNAIKKYDPNHLFLGSRFYGKALQSSGAFRAAGRYVDVVSVNYYGVWTPETKTMEHWLAWSDKPFLITEFYTKGADAGLPNTTGAGWIVPTQRERGLFYQNYVLALLRSSGCVGWQWFKYMDNDPDDPHAEPSNRDSNKGLVSTRFEPYWAMVSQMSEVNHAVYSIIDFFTKATKR